MSETAIVTVEPVVAVAEYHRKATDVAGLVKALVLSKVMKIGPKRYVPVDAYQAIANAMGCVASARDVRRIDTGYTAIGEVRRLSDGKVIGEGEGFVGDDEPKWAKGPEYARRAMVQTRAIGRACRAAFAFVVPMIDLGLSTTPAEEMEGIAADPSDAPPAPAGVDKLKHQANGAPRQTPPPARADERRPTHDRTLHFGFGNEKGVVLADISDDGLTWYRGCLKRDLDDASKARWHEKTKVQLGHLEAELRHRGLPV